MALRAPQHAEFLISSVPTFAFDVFFLVEQQQISSQPRVLSMAPRRRGALSYFGGKRATVAWISLLRGLDEWDIQGP